MRVSLLHGFAGAPSVWTAVGLDATALRLPGHGLPVANTWEANLDGLDLGGADVVVGYSLGARIALGLVARGRVERAILIGVNPGIDDAERGARRASDAAWVRLLRERGLEAFLDAWEAQPLFATQARVPRERLAERRAHRLALDAEQLARSLEVMGLAEMPDYRTIVGRCALIVGGDDAKFLAIARSITTPTVIPDAGHDVPLEQPEALARAIRGLLE